MFQYFFQLFKLILRKLDLYVNTIWISDAHDNTRGILYFNIIGNIRLTKLLKPLKTKRNLNISLREVNTSF